MMATEAGRGRARKRESILRTAIDVFVREGYDGANLDVIAAEADVVKRTIYNHFGDKETLFLAAFENAFDRTNARTLATLESFPDQPGNLESELVTFGKRLAECLFEEEASALRALADAEAVRRRELVASARERGPGKVVALLSERFAEWRDAGLLRSLDPHRAAYHFIGLATHEIQVRTVAGQQISATEFDHAVEDGVRTFLRAYDNSQRS